MSSTDTAGGGRLGIIQMGAGARGEMQPAREDGAVDLAPLIAASAAA